MNSMVRDAVNRWRGERVPPTLLNGKPAPTSLNEAQDLRAAAVLEQKDLEARMAAAHGYEKEMLRRKVSAAQAHISEINAWIVKARQCAPMRAATPLAVPVLAPAAAAPLIVSAPVFPNRCACGEEVEPERLRESWVFYCQNCGADWSHPAPRERQTPKPRRAVKRCTCAHQCRFCGGEKR